MNYRMFINSKLKNVPIITPTRDVQCVECVQDVLYESMYECVSCRVSCGTRYYNTAVLQYDVFKRIYIYTLRDTRISYNIYYSNI